MIDRMRNVVGLATISISLLGCAAGSAASLASTDRPVASSPALASPAAVASPEPRPTTRIVESARHGYRIEVPSGWAVTEHEGTWETLDQFGVGVEVPGEDVLDSTELQAYVVINSMAIPDGMTDEEWLAAFDAVVRDALPPDCPGSPVAGTFAGQAAMILEQDCAGSTIVGRTVAHAGRGYYVTTVAPTDGDAGPSLDGMLASMTFLD